MQVFNGLSINFGTVLASACLYSAERHRTILETKLRSDAEIARELTRLQDSVHSCSADLDLIMHQTSQSIGATEAEIFLTQKHILNDPAILDKIHAAVTTDKQNVEFAVHRVYSAFEEQFKQLDNVYMRERAGDISEVRTRLLDKLRGTRPGFICEGQVHCSRGRNRVIAAEELTPDMIVHMDLEKVKGFVTEHGGISSHAAVIARSLGVPAVSGVSGFLDHVRCGDKILIDGDTGTVYLNPTEKVIDELAPKHRTEEAIEVVVTPEGMEVMANASLLEDVKMARAVQADGIGLFRTEILFLRESRLLTEDEQTSVYQQIVQMMEGRPVVFRLLDVGGDKPLPFLRIEQETNPYLGWRGARFLLGSPDILRMQVRALAAVSRNTPVRMMIPMVVDASQAARLLTLIYETLDDAGASRDRISIGAMFEVPSAIFDAAGIFDQVDFGSIGSNDLIQYTFAIDRNNERVSSDYNPEHPILWNMLEQLAAAARAKGKSLSICGEMAAREGIPSRLISAGIRSLSVSPRLVSRVRCELAGCLVPEQEMTRQPRTQTA
jgi:phosphoenolpyruvate-protein phosphotransferase (PTS system enzyme I)